MSHRIVSTGSHSNSWNVRPPVWWNCTWQYFRLYVFMFENRLYQSTAAGASIYTDPKFNIKTSITYIRLQLNFLSLVHNTLKCQSKAPCSFEKNAFYTILSTSVCMSVLLEYTKLSKELTFWHQILLTLFTAQSSKMGFIESLLLVLPKQELKVIH